MDANVPLRSLGPPIEGVSGEAARVRGMLLSATEAARAVLGAAQDSEAPQRLSAMLKAMLKSALRARQSVEMATGMLMERHRIGREEARNHLLKAPRVRRQPLAELAGQLVGRSADPEL